MGFRQTKLFGDWVYLYNFKGIKTFVSWFFFEKYKNNPTCNVIYKIPEKSSTSEISDFMRFRVIGENWQRIK